MRRLELIEINFADVKIVVFFSVIKKSEETTNPIIPINTMTVCGKSNENTKMNVQSRNLVSNRPSFMITDILSKTSDDKAPVASHSAQYLQHLERFSAMNHGFGMMIPSMMPMQEQSQRNQKFCDSDDDDGDDDDFHGSDDADGHSTDGSHRKLLI